MKGKSLLYAQIILILLLFYLGSFPQIFKSLLLTVIFALGALLGVWSAYNLGLDTFTQFPEPRNEGKHVQVGTYKYVRHPMYTAIILIALSLALSSLSFVAIIIFLLLIYVLDQKASLEEKFLTKLHPTYKVYAQKTKKFIPFVY